MKVAVKARHIEVTDAIRDYVESKVAKVSRFYNNVQSVEVILDIEADQPVVEAIVTARRRNVFVATYRGPDMYACIDQCLHKISEQLRRHKDKVRDRQGPPHSQTMGTGGG